MVHGRTRMVYSVQKAFTARPERSMQISTHVPREPLVRKWVREINILLVPDARQGISASIRRRPLSVQSYTRDTTEMECLDGAGLTHTCALSSPTARKARQMQLPPVLTVNGQLLAAQTQLIRAFLARVAIFATSLTCGKMKISRGGDASFRPSRLLTCKKTSAG